MHVGIGAGIVVEEDTLTEMFLDGVNFSDFETFLAAGVIAHEASFELFRGNVASFAGLFLFSELGQIVWWFVD